MKKNIIIFITICISLFSYFIFDYLKFDGEIVLDSEIKLPRIIKAYITGEVITPGVYELDENSRLEDLIKISGGLSSEANITNINLAMIIKDGDKVVIPKFSEDLSERVKDLNLMTIEDFMLINSIGEVTAKKIVAYRNKVGYLTLDNITEIEGIGDAKALIIREYLEN
ncbi:MAG: SLBB domain-containing protein [Clostridiales bacterium]|nr:SLBB domain-containing protein [Clostridiales bacterium]